jgi:hypothetical protein
MSYKNVGRVWDILSYEEYLKTVKAPPWATKVTIHHCSSPSLKQRPKGLLAEHLNNLKSYYQNTKGWSSGPHYFIDEDQIWGMTPPTEKGVHAVAYNSNSIGAEILGDYDSEDPFNGRGQECWKLAADWAWVTLKWLNLKPSTKTIVFHREDPNTTKTCPGTKIEKNWFIEMVKAKDFLKEPAPFVTPEVLPIAEFVTSKKGYSYEDVKKLLKVKNGLIFFGDDWLEGAYYDKQKNLSVAPLSELNNIVKK